MKLIQVLCMVLTELSVGSLLMVCLLPPREIRTGFFTFNSLVCALAAAISLMLSKGLLQSAWWTSGSWFPRSSAQQPPTVRSDWRNQFWERLLLLISGLAGFAFGLLPLAGQILAARGMETTAPLFFDAGVLSATLLLGATNVG